MTDDSLFLSSKVNASELDWLNSIKYPFAENEKLFQSRSLVILLRSQKTTNKLWSWELVTKLCSCFAYALLLIIQNLGSCHWHTEWIPGAMKQSKACEKIIVSFNYWTSCWAFSLDIPCSASVLGAKPKKKSMFKGTPEEAEVLFCDSNITLYETNLRHCWIKIMYFLIWNLICITIISFFSWPSLNRFFFFCLCITAIRNVSCCLCCQLTLPEWWKLRLSRDWRVQTVAKWRTQTIFTTSMSKDTLMSGMYYLFCCPLIWLSSIVLYSIYFSQSTAQINFHVFECYSYY